MPEKAPKIPQDHKQKNAPFTFKVAGEVYTLPKVGEDVASKVPGEVTYAAIMDPDNPMAQMRLGFATLEAAGPSEKAMKALKSLPTDEMLAEIGRWMGESQGSSD